jgi:hypothetical protein
MIRALYLLVLIILPGQIIAQSFLINLSPNHQQKLNTIKSGHQRMMKYYKYYKKDSTHHSKKQEKKYKHTIDSTFKAERKDERLRKRMARKGIILPDNRLAKADETDKQLRYWHTVMKDSCSSDSTRKAAKLKVRELAIEKAKRHPGFQHLTDRYNISGDTVNWQQIAQQVPGLDTLSEVFDSSPEQLFKVAEEQSIKQFSDFTGAGAVQKEFAEAEKLKSLPDQYKKEYEKYTDKDQLKKEGKDKAVNEAMDYFAAHPERIQAAQAKMGKLLSKYREFSNSADLKGAVKQTSMQGKTFFEHLVFGGNFNILSTDPVSVDLSPMLGYKFTTKFFIGVGMVYRHTFSDSIKNSWYVSPVNTGYKVFANYDVAKGFFAYTEWERSGIASKLNDKSKKEWKNNYFIGAGKKFLVHPKLYLVTTLLYNLNNEDHNPVHPRRFQVKVGFQLSELATRKKKIYYNPNR